MDAEPEGPRGKKALVVMTAEAGSVLLKGPEGDVNLVWTGEGLKEPRALPPGSYAIRTVRVERERKGEHWFLSTTGPAGKPFELAAGKKKTLKVPTGVTFQGRAKSVKGGLALGFTLTAGKRRGVSVYHEDRRVDVTYRVLDKSGKPLAEGKMNYG